MGGPDAAVHVAQGLTVRDVRVCVIYMCLASVMWVVNKKTITHLPVPFFVTLTQALATCAILKTCQYLKVIHMQPFSWETFGGVHAHRYTTRVISPSPGAARRAHCSCDERGDLVSARPPPRAFSRVRASETPPRVFLLQRVNPPSEEIGVNFQALAFVHVRHLRR